MNYQTDAILSSIATTRDALLSRPGTHWVIAFSGGKDSSALLKIFYAAYRRIKQKSLKITIIYCDTGVESIALDRYIKTTLELLEQEFQLKNDSISIKILKANVYDRFFVRIIGRGYPPPNKNFRWCTKSLRITPVMEFIESTKRIQDTVVLLGLRRNESQQRDRSLSQSKDSFWQVQRDGNRQVKLFLPIINLSTEQTWDAVFFDAPQAIEGAKLEQLYRGASGECPVLKAPQSPPCASGRFGCWTCTVVRQDKSSSELIKSGHDDLRPFLEFRNWLVDIRNDPLRRWPQRRNGGPGLGPFSIEARKEILSKVSQLEISTKVPILSSEERLAIAEQWKIDDRVRVDFRSLRRESTPVGSKE